MTRITDKINNVCPEQPPKYIPTLEEIAIATAEIRATWTDEELKLRRRRGKGPEEGYIYEKPQYRISNEE